MPLGKPAKLAMMKVLNDSGDYAAVYANIEGAQAARGNSEQGIDAICAAIANAIGLMWKPSKTKP
jgi:hypothetical protein